MNEKTLPATRFDGFTNAGKLRQASHNVPAVRFTADDGSDYPEWEEKKLKDSGFFYGGLSGKSSSDFENGNSRFLTYMNVYKNTFAHQDLTGSVKISENETPNEVEYGDILFTQSSETVEEVGLSSVYLFNDRPYLNSFCMGFRPNSLSELDPGYMGYCMRAMPVRRQIMIEGQGISRINISASRLGSIKFSVPSPSEQKKIASLLSSVDETLDLCQRKLDLLTQAKKALMQQIFSQKVRFTADDGSDFPEWEEKKLGRLCESIASGKTKKSAEGQIPLWGSSGLLGHTKEAEFKGDYLIIGRVGVAAGCVRHYVGDFSASDNTLVIKPMIQEISSVWLTGYLEYFNLNRLTFGSSQPLITATQLKRLSVITPKLQEQQKIASCLSSADALIAQARAELEQWQEVKKSLLQQLFV